MLEQEDAECLLAEVFGTLGLCNRCPNGYPDKTDTAYAEGVGPSGPQFRQWKYTSCPSGCLGRIYREKLHTRVSSLG